MYWFLYGLFIGAGAMRVGIWVLEGSIIVPWYTWITGIITFLLLSLTLQTFIASFMERESRAAWMSLLFLGVPTIFLGAITMVSV
jgi:hypothetical protein